MNEMVWIARCESKGLAIVVNFNGRLKSCVVRNEGGVCNYKFKTREDADVSLVKFIQKNIFPYNTNYDYGYAPEDKKLKSTQPNLVYRKGLQEIPYEKVKEHLEQEGFDLSNLKVTKLDTNIGVTIEATSSPLSYTYTRVEDYDVTPFGSLGCQKPFLGKLFENKITNAVLLIGAPGTGKSTEFKIYAAQNKIPFYQMQLNAQSLSFDLLSEFIPNTEDSNSPAKMKRSPFTNAYEHGGICQIDEINMASAGALAALNSALDDTAQITLSDGTVIKRHENFFLVATMNPLLEGTKALNQATLNRFFTYYWEQDSKSELIEKLKVKTGPKAAPKLADLHMNVKKFLEDAGLNVDITVRNTINFARAISIVPDTDMKTKEEVFISTYVTPIISDVRDLKEFAQYRSGLLAIFKKSIFGADFSKTIEDEL